MIVAYLEINDPHWALTVLNRYQTWRLSWEHDNWEYERLEQYY